MKKFNLEVIILRGERKVWRTSRSESRFAKHDIIYVASFINMCVVLCVVCGQSLLVSTQFRRIITTGNLSGRRWMEPSRHTRIFSVKTESRTQRVPAHSRTCRMTSPKHAWFARVVPSRITALNSAIGWWFDNFV